MMVDLDTEICVCNDVTVKEMVKCVKENNLKTLEEVIENEICPIGDKCEACRDEGFHDDGINITLILSMVEKGKI